MNRNLALVLILGALALALPLAAQTPPVLPGDEACRNLGFPFPVGGKVLEEGRALYVTHCASCHGAQGRGDGPTAVEAGFRATDLTSPGSWRLGSRQREVYRTVVYGLPDHDGHAFGSLAGGPLSEEQSWQLTAAVLALALPPQARTSPSGLQWVTLRAGQGPAATAGGLVRAHYVGWLTDGHKFDSSYDRGQPLQFRLGAGQVIPGWDEGVQGMQAGELRQLVIPASLAYGQRGVGPIPPGATLVFQVELLEMR